MQNLGEIISNGCHRSWYLHICFMCQCRHIHKRRRAVDLRAGAPARRDTSPLLMAGVSSWWAHKSSSNADLSRISLASSLSHHPPEFCRKTQVIEEGHLSAVALKKNLSPEPHFLHLHHVDCSVYAVGA